MRRALGSMSLLLVVALAASAATGGLDAASVSRQHQGQGAAVRCLAEVSVRRIERQVRRQAERPIVAELRRSAVAQGSTRETPIETSSVVDLRLLVLLTDLPPPAMA